MVGWTISEIQTEFDNEGFSPNLAHDPGVSGMRRGLVEQIYQTIDFGDHWDVFRLLEVYQTVVATTRRHQPDLADALIDHLRRDGVDTEGPSFRLRANTPTALQPLKAVAQSLTAAQIHAQIDRINRSIDSDSALAIGTAKELLETICKTILTEVGDEPGNLDLGDLVKRTTQRLKLLPRLADVPDPMRNGALRRLTHLETQGWVTREGTEAWRLPPDLADKLQAFGEREARERAATKALWGGDWSGQLSRLEPITLNTGDRVVGAFAGTAPIGPYYTGAQVVVLDGLDGRLGHVRVPRQHDVLVLDRIAEGAVVQVRAFQRQPRPADRTIAEIAAERGGVYSADDHRAARPSDTETFIERHVRRMESLSRAGACQSLGEGRFAVPADFVDRAAAVDCLRDGSAALEVRVLDPRAIDQQIEAKAYTWLDTQLAPGVAASSQGPFGEIVREALPQRAAWLRSLGLGTGEPLTLSPKDVKTLSMMEVQATFERLGAHGKPVFLATQGQTFSGVYMSRVQVGRVPYAVIEGRHAITLAPWRPALEACRGQGMTATLQSGTVDFRFGQQRGQGLGLEL